MTISAKSHTRLSAYTDFDPIYPTLVGSSAAPCTAVVNFVAEEHLQINPY